MADVRLHGVTVGPGGAGWRHAVAAHTKPGSFVTSFDDQLLHSVKWAQELPEVDFVSFGELVSRIGRMLGVPEKRQATAGQRQALMEAVLSRVPADSWLEPSAPYIGTAKVLVERLAELRHAGIDAAKLATVAEQPDPARARRLSALALVAAEYEAGLAKAGRETLADRIAACMASDSDAPFPFKDLLVLTGGGSADPLAEQFLLWLARRGTKVTVATERPEGSLFGRAQHWIDAFGLGEPKPTGKAWYDGLFRESIESPVPEAHLLVAPDVLTECEEVVRWCLQAGRDGILPHRIGVFARDAASYGPLMLASAQRLGLPLAATVSSPLLTSGFARLVLRTLQAMASPDVRDLGHLASSSYFSDGWVQRSELWTLLRACHATGDGWGALYGKPPSETAAWPWVAPLVEWRHANHHAEVNLADWTASLMELVSDCGLSDQIQSQSDGSARDQRAQVVLQRSLAERAGHHDRVIDLHTFVALCRRVWERETVVVRFHDQRGEAMGQTVSLVSSSSQLGEFDALAVVGMTEGTLPRRRRDDPVLSDGDRAYLRTTTGAYLEDSSTTAEAERDEFVRVCASAGKRLLFSYPASDETRDNVPTLYLDEARRCIGEMPEVHVRRGHYAPKPSLCLNPADLELRTCLDDPLPARPTPFVASDEARELVRPAPDEEVAAQEIAEAHACPFRAAARHRLKLSSPYYRSSLGSLVSVAERARLHAQPDQASAVAAMEAELDRRMAELYPSLETWEVSLLTSAGRRFIHKWAEREFAVRNRQQGAETPEEPTRHVTGKFSVAGRSTPYGATVGDLGVIDGVAPVVRHYTSRSVDSKAMAEDPSIELLARLIAMPVAAKTKRAVVEMDTPAEARVLFTVGNVAGPRFRKADGTVKFALDEWEAMSGASNWFVEWCDRVKSVAKDALAAVLAGDMRPRPGTYCGRCGYADLCRSAKGNDPEEGAASNS